VVSEEVFQLEYPSDFSGLGGLLDREFPTARSGFPGKAAVAQELQVATEELLLRLAEAARRHTGERCLAYGGGVALNCRANGVLAASGIFDQVSAGPASHDAGTAVGAAWDVFTRTTDLPVPLQSPDVVVYPGPDPAAGRARALGVPTGWRRIEPDGESQEWVHRKTVDILLRNVPVGWVNGRCEFGPRALGGRSLLSAASAPDVVDRVNSMKGRMVFEPLACSIREEDIDKWFVVPPGGQALADNMLIAVRPVDSRVRQLRHITHQDGTVRLHIVKKAVAPQLHRLLGEVARRLPLPMLVEHFP